MIRTSKRGPPSGAAVIRVVLLAVAASVAGCSTSSSPAAGTVRTAALPSIAVPLATSVRTQTGIWATVAMGHLDDPLNTFWQLFYRPDGAASWTNQVEATAVATNGGLVLASNGGRSLTVGIRPSNLLSFSPLLSTSDGGHSWANGLLPVGLASRADALAAGAPGRGLALVGHYGSMQVLASIAGPSNWVPLVSQAELAGSAAGAICDLQSLTAVGYLGAGPIVAGACSRPGVVGVFVARAGGWDLVGPSLPAQLAGGRTEVLALQPASGGLCALVAVADQAGAALVAAWTAAGGNTWTTSPPLPLPPSGAVLSVGPDSASGLFVLMSAPSRADSLYVVHGPRQPWTELPSPPSGTATVAFQPGSVTDALAVDDTVLTVWTVGPGSTRWTKGQVINVPIQFGSSG